MSDNITEIQKFCFEYTTFTCISDSYINSKTKLKYMCNICSIIISKKPGVFQKWHKCMNCISIENFKKVKEILENNNYIVLSTKYNSKGIEYLCSKHGKKKTSAKNIKNGCICTDCACENKKITYEIAKYKVEIEHANLKLKMISTEYNKATLFKVECIICGYIFNYSMNYLCTQRSCKKCSFAQRRASFDIISLRIAKYNFTLINIFYETGNTTLYEVECSDNHIFKNTMYNIEKGARCPHCVTSLNFSETVCRKYIEYLFGRTFNKKKFDWLINDKGNKMELDGYNEELNIGFEYDGIIHSKFVEYFHKTEEQFRKRQNDDRIKDKLCFDHGVILIRVPYTIKYHKILDYLKDQCTINNIKYENKPNIDIKELDVFNNIIEKRNNLFDDKIKDSIWIRISNATSTNIHMSLQCKNCNNIVKILYGNIMNQGKKIPECKSCFNNNKTDIISNIAFKYNFKLIDKYISSETHVKLECNICSNQLSFTPHNLYIRISPIICNKCT